MEKEAPLEKVRVADTVVQACLSHAFTTEQEEVMGLLLGEVTVHYTLASTVAPSTVNLANTSIMNTAKVNKTDVLPAATSVYKRANVWESWILQRSVRRSDRVEIAPELLAGASEEAERCTAQVGRHTRVIGWYHSHPRITPYPSQVDLRSQGLYQMMESGWVGLIFSVFYSDTTNKNSLSIHCFQTGPGETHRKVELEIIPVAQMPLKTLPPCDVTHRLLRVFSAEVEAAVEMVRKQSKNAPGAVSAALALKEVQLYSLDNLIAKPALEQLSSTVSFLEKEINRLERELARLSAQ